MKQGIIASSRVKYCAEFITYNNAVLAAGGELSQSQKSAINTFIIGLKNAGLWSDIIAFYPFLSADSQTLAAENTHKINMKNPGTFNLTYLGGSLPANHYSTYFLTNTTQVCDTGINASTSISADNNTIGAKAIGASSGPIIAVKASAATSSTTPTFGLHNYMVIGGSVYKPGLQSYSYLYQGTGNLVLGTSAGGTAYGIGSFAGVRRAVNNASVYRNGANVNNNTIARTIAPPAYNLYIGGYNNGSAGTFTGNTAGKAVCNIWLASRGFSDAEITTYQGLEDTFNTATGR